MVTGKVARMTSFNFLWQIIQAMAFWSWSAPPTPITKRTIPVSSSLLKNRQAPFGQVMHPQRPSKIYSKLLRRSMPIRLIRLVFISPAFRTEEPVPMTCPGFWHRARFLGRILSLPQLPCRPLLATTSLVLSRASPTCPCGFFMPRTIPLHPLLGPTTRLFPLSEPSGIQSSTAAT